MKDSDFPRYFKQAEPMLPAMTERSEEYKAGYHYGLAFVLAGSWWEWHRDIPHGTGYPERDAWLYGFEKGQEHAEREAAR